MLFLFHCLLYNNYLLSPFVFLLFTGLKYKAKQHASREKRARERSVLFRLLLLFRTLLSIMWLRLQKNVFVVTAQMHNEI